MSDAGVRILAWATALPVFGLIYLLRRRGWIKERPFWVEYTAYGLLGLVVGLVLFALVL